MWNTLNEGGFELQLKTLQAVQEEIIANGNQAAVEQIEWGDGQINVLSADLIRSGIEEMHFPGEYYFQPVSGDPDGGQYFRVIITLHDDLPADYVPELAFALSVINFYLEAGCFALNKPTDLLVFKNTRTFSGDTPEETLIKECVLVAEEAYAIALKYCKVLLAVADGSLTLTQFMEMVETE